MEIRGVQRSSPNSTIENLKLGEQEEKGSPLFQIEVAIREGSITIRDTCRSKKS